MALHKHQVQTEDVISIDRNLDNALVHPLARKQKLLMKILQKITCSVNESLTAEEALKLCLENICRHTGWVVGHARAVARRPLESSNSADVWYLAARKPFRYFHSGAESTEIESLPCLLQRVLKEKRAIYIADLLNDSQFRTSDVARKVGLCAASGFPIWTGKEIGGVLEFFSDKEMDRDAPLLQFLTNVGVQLGRVVERARAEQSISHLSASLLRTQDYERRRIARDLHDSTSQNLVAIKMKLVSILKAMSGNPQIGAQVTNCCDLVNGCVKEIRTISHLLHPPLLDELGLATAVRCYAEGYAQRSHVGVNVSVNPALGRLDRDVEIAFFRIVQEALTNIHRHSSSRDARITIGRSIKETFVEIADSGKGIPDVVVDPNGNSFCRVGVGIASMRERIEELNGRLEISSSSNGTIVRASVPRSKSRCEKHPALV